MGAAFHSAPALTTAVRSLSKTETHEPVSRRRARGQAGDCGPAQPASTGGAASADPGTDEEHPGADRSRHPGPSLAITALITLLAAQAAPHGTGPVLVAPAVLAGQLSIGWSNDAFDAGRDAVAGRADKPIAAGGVSRRAVGIAAAAALAASVIAAFAIGGSRDCQRGNDGRRVGLQRRPEVDPGVRAHVHRRIRPDTRVRGQHAARPPAARPWTIAAAAAVGLGGHFANVIPDLAGDEAAGVRGLPQRLAARSGPSPFG